MQRNTDRHGKEFTKYSKNISRGEIPGGTGAVNCKYNTLLYLCACRYAYEQLVKSDAKKWKKELYQKKIPDAAATLAAYSDGELTVTVKNRPLPLEESGFYKGEDARAADYLNRSSEELAAGNLRQALCILLEGDAACGSPLVKAAIENYCGRVSFQITSSPGQSAGEAAISDSEATPPPEGTWAHEYGLVLYDSEREKSQTVLRVTVHLDEDETASSEDGGLVSRGGRCFFYIWSGAGRASCFYYDVQTNRAQTLEYGLTNLELLEDKVVATTMSFAAAEESELYIYNWNGEKLTERVTAGSLIKDGRIYYLTKEPSGQNTLYSVRRMTPGGKEDVRLCRIEIAAGCVWMEDSEILWYDGGVTGRMPLSAPHDVWRAKVEKTKEEIFNSLRRQIVDYYTALGQPEGNYVCFERDFRETESSYEFVLRYQMSDREAAEREAMGLRVMPNIYVTKITVDKATAKATDEEGAVSWYVAPIWRTEG